MNASHKATRLDYLDAVRAFALLLGIVFHASISFLPIYIGWAVMDIHTSSAVSIFMLISHSFRMELFFLIAGFFSHMTFHAKGLKSFAKSRFVRIAIPFALGWFILRPLLISGWIMGAESLRGEVNVIAGLKSGFATLNQLPTDLFVGTHLWFLYYLLLITCMTLILRFILSISEKVKNLVHRSTDSLVHWCSRSRFALIALALPTTAALWFMSHWGMDTPDKSLIPMAPVLLTYGGFFLFGWILHRKAALIEQFASLNLSKVIVGVVAVVLSVYLSGFESQQGHAYYLYIKVAYLFSYALMMWSLVALSIGLFKRFFSRPSKLVRYIADASYWLYLIHLPIVIWLQIAFAEIELYWLLKLSAISAITILLSLALYDLLVRATFIGAVLNGKRKSRAIFFSKKLERAKVEINYRGTQD